jgi:hypothetical protein
MNAVHRELLAKIARELETSEGGAIRILILAELGYRKLPAVGPLSNAPTRHDMGLRLERPRALDCPLLVKLSTTQDRFLAELARKFFENGTVRPRESKAATVRWLICREAGRIGLLNPMADFVTRMHRRRRSRPA